MAAVSNAVSAEILTAAVVMQDLSCLRTNVTVLVRMKHVESLDTCTLQKYLYIHGCFVCCGPRLHYSIDLRTQTCKQPVVLKYGKLATKYPWIYGYF